MSPAEVIDEAKAAGLTSPRIMPHKGKSGQVHWNLFYGPADDRKCVVLPRNVDKKRLNDAIWANAPA